MGIVGSDDELTRKQRRDHSRAERKAAEEAAATDAARRKRLSQLGAVVAVVLLGIVAVLIVTGGGSKTRLEVGGLREAAAVSAVLAGTTQNGTVLGSPTAPVTMQYFGDLECPACRAFTLGALPSIIHRWVSSGGLKIEYRSLETATREPETFRTQQVAMLAAGRQDKAWNFIELFYHEQGEEASGYVTENYLQGLAKQVPGLDLAKWTADRGDQKFALQVTADAQAANGSGLTSTPGFLIGKSGGTLRKYEYASLTDPSGFDAAIERAMKS